MATFAANVSHLEGRAMVLKSELLDLVPRQVQVPDDYARRRSTDIRPPHGCRQGVQLEFRSPSLALGHFGARSRAHASVEHNNLVTLRSFERPLAAPAQGGKRSTGDDIHRNAHSQTELPVLRQATDLGVGDLRAV